MTHKKIMAALVAVFMCGTAFAAGARLFNQTDFVPRAKEAATLNAAEAAHLALFRAEPALYKDIQVVKINQAAVGSGVITLTTPTGEPLEYVGSTKMVEGYPLWIGTSQAGGRATFAIDKDGGFGKMIERTAIYRLVGLKGGRFFVLMRVTPPPFHDLPAPAAPAASPVR